MMKPFPSGNVYLFSCALVCATFFFLAACFTSRAADSAPAHLEGELTKAILDKDEERAFALYKQLENSLELLRASKASAVVVLDQLDGMIAKALERSEDPDLSPSAAAVHAKQAEALGERKAHITKSIAEVDLSIEEAEKKQAGFAAEPVLRQRLEEQAIMNKIKGAINAAGDIKLPGE